MATSRPCADAPCCPHPSAVLGVQQTLEEMDFERDPSSNVTSSEALPKHPGSQLWAVLPFKGLWQCLETFWVVTIWRLLQARRIWSAALNGDLGRVKHLIQKAEDPSQPDSAGYTALHYASRNGHYAVCQFLLESGANCDAQTHGGATALHRASYCGHTEIARLLLSHGSNPRVVDDDGMTSLHKAAERGHGDICSLLLQHSPALKAVRDRKARLACDLLPCNSDLQDLLSS
ncbi:ankyrin repeat domain-containing protein 39 isoform X2 [Saimiri boliviensis]|uniref:ankyrin repeat domain-containing protein 39 isoform X2 n=1 Tax=Saimiri boliviensis TaxID=27679 RepID=UPI00193DFFFD|nr:ankyrin repeat domain-containing protein 39 isoform X1 [Saimiri boliviensis boliviensis]